ncbi:EAL and HDOD domain-containing protein [Desulfovibrio inopinatus]|uniref:EAL and HDOD domain-containing protein n=1 Tax=Desulfovibrio inopinatus TaxID=102109 RepID=UPI00146FC650|nr:HDOD domain-containing protein [Desulfovibrio inopinatus]
MSVMAAFSLCPDADFQTAFSAVHLSGDGLTEHITFALPPQATVVVIDEEIGADPERVALVSELKSAGYTIAVCNYQAQISLLHLYRMADIIVIDVKDLPRHTLSSLVAPLQKLNVQLWARKIEDYETLGIVQELGFSYFQGFFFKKPKTLKGRKISASEAARLRILQILEHNEPDFEEMTTAIEADVSMSYRFLAYLNSPGFGLTQKISSIKHAILLVGWQRVRSWLRLVLLTDITPPDKTQELSVLAAQRARFLERLAESSGFPKIAENVFSLGLFSLLDTMLENSMESILAKIPLNDDIKIALIEHRGRFAPWLHLTLSMEQTDWSRLDQLIEDLNLDPATVISCYQEALDWTANFFNATR